MRQGATVDQFDVAFPLRQAGQWSPATLARRAWSGVLRHRAVVAVLLVYALCALIVPTMTPAPVSDDWVYARSVETLVREHRLAIIDLSVVTLIFQVVWGGLFALLFGPTFGALRLSTVTLMLLGGVACYGICRELR